MTTAIRWRIMVLQALAILALGFCAGFLYYESSFVTGMVHDQLSAQKIFFPQAGTAALDPKEFPDLQQYAGQQVDNGDKAKAYANGFIGRHLQSVAGGLTYAEVSARAQQSPTDTKLAAQKATLFQGEMLRSTLLNAWGWSQLGLYALYAAIGLTVATALALGAFVFELALMLRRETVRTGAVATGRPATTSV